MITHGTPQLSGTQLPQANADAMVRRGAALPSITTAIGNHAFRATA